MNGKLTVSIHNIHQSNTLIENFVNKKSCMKSERAHWQDHFKPDPRKNSTILSSFKPLLETESNFLLLELC